LHELPHARQYGVELLPHDLELLSLRRIRRRQRVAPRIPDRALKSRLERLRSRLLTTGTRRISRERLLRIAQLAFERADAPRQRRVRPRCFVDGALEEPEAR